jgi:hypothetical protein
LATRSGRITIIEKAIPTYKVCIVILSVAACSVPAVSKNANGQRMDAHAKTLFVRDQNQSKKWSGILHSSGQPSLGIEHRFRYLKINFKTVAHF